MKRRSFAIVASLLAFLVLPTATQVARVGLYVDEWGTWYSPEPGSNPAFLVQQNSIRDAVVGGASFNIFHRHAKRVKMANIAQLVNGLADVGKS